MGVRAKARTYPTAIFSQPADPLNEHTPLRTTLAPILNAQGISKQFGADPLLRDVSFTVEERARIGLIGPNGSGKSTLLGILAGEIEPDSGEVIARKRTRLSYVAQQSEFTPGTTVRAVLEASLKRIAAPSTE